MSKDHSLVACMLTVTAMLLVVVTASPDVYSAGQPVQQQLTITRKLLKGSTTSVITDDTRAPSSTNDADTSSAEDDAEALEAEDDAEVLLAEDDAEAIEAEDDAEALADEADAIVSSATDNAAAVETEDNAEALAAGFDADAMSEEDEAQAVSAAEVLADNAGAATNDADTMSAEDKAESPTAAEVLAPIILAVAGSKNATAAAGDGTAGTAGKGQPEDNEADAMSAEDEAESPSAAEVLAPTILAVAGSKNGTAVAGNGSAGTAGRGGPGDNNRPWPPADYCGSIRCPTYPNSVPVDGEVAGANSTTGNGTTSGIASGNPGRPARKEYAEKPVKKQGSTEDSLAELSVEDFDGPVEQHSLADDS